MIKRLFVAVTALLSLSASAQNCGEPEISIDDYKRSDDAVTRQTIQKWEKLEAPVNLLIGSDLGRNGYYYQKPIAEIMGKMAETIEPVAVLALGDIHHYMGVQSVNDPLWQSNYENIYSHPELMVDWNAVCGNHEYRGDTQAVIDYSSVSRRWEMPAKYYAKTYSDKGVEVKVVFIDTTPIIDKYRNNPDKYPDASAQDVDAQLAWLDRELSGTTEDWIIVAGHHPIYADTPKDDSERSDMQRKVDTILRKHRVDMYIAGHIHNFQHIQRNGIDYIVNSSGSLSRKNVKPIEGTKFVSGDPGFSVISATKDMLSLSMIGKEGKIIHQINRQSK